MQKAKKRKDSESCEILLTNFGEGPVQLVGGVITLQNGELSYTANESYQTAMENIMSEVEGDPEAWFEGLPSYYTGSMVRAYMVEAVATRTKRPTRKLSKETK